MKRLPTMPTKRFAYTLSERGAEPAPELDSWIVESLPCEVIPARRWFGAILIGLMLACAPALVGCDDPIDHYGPDEKAHVRQGHSVARVQWGGHEVSQ